MLVEPNVNRCWALLNRLFHETHQRLDQLRRAEQLSGGCFSKSQMLGATMVLAAAASRPEEGNVGRTSVKQLDSGVFQREARRKEVVQAVL